MPVSVWTSTLQRTIQTAEQLPFPKLRWKVSQSPTSQQNPVLYKRTSSQACTTVASGSSAPNPIPAQHLGLTMYCRDSGAGAGRDPGGRV
jgi:hypothetical protein